MPRRSRGREPAEELIGLAVGEGGQESQPLLLVLAGPNGAGKSTFYDVYVKGVLEVPFVNADHIARTLAPDPLSMAYEAASVAEDLRRKLLGASQSFCMETVFSDPEGAKLSFLKEARAAGYTVILVFIGIDSPELSMARVSQRVLEGGHDVPDEKIQSRYPRTLQNLRASLSVVDYAVLIDNSSADEPYRFVATYVAGELSSTGAVRPAWAAELSDLSGPSSG
jgi:predicted ABC-type ATPase